MNPSWSQDIPCDIDGLDLIHSPDDANREIFVQYPPPYDGPGECQILRPRDLEMLGPPRERVPLICLHPRGRDRPMIWVQFEVEHARELGRRLIELADWCERTGE
jgi:hypothetical protein